MIFFYKEGFDEILKFALDDASEVDHQSDSKLAQNVWSVETDPVSFDNGAWIQGQCAGDVVTPV